MKYFITDKSYYVYSVLISILIVLAYFSRFSEVDFVNFFSSDTLYLPSIYKDLFIDHNNLEGWVFNPAPNFFPDMILYFIINFITQDFVLASMIFGIVQYLFFLFLIAALFRLILPVRPMLFAALANLFMLLFFFVAFYTDEFFYSFYLISNSYHTGAFLMAFLCAILTFMYFKDPKKWHLITIAMIAILCIISDRLFIALYSLPVFSLIVLYKTIVPHKTLIKILLINIFSVVAGIIAFHLICKLQYFSVEENPILLDLKNMRASLIQLGGQMWHAFKYMAFVGIITTISLLSFIALNYIFFKEIRKNKSLLVIFFFFVLAYSFIVFLAPVISGNYTGPDRLRYNIYVFYMLVITFWVVIAFFIYKYGGGARAFRVVKGALLTCLSVALFFGIIHLSLRGLKQWFNYYPTSVSCIDNIAKENNLTYGVGNYWIAKRTTMFSRNGVRIYAIWEDAAPAIHVCNKNWYNNKNIKFEFVVLHESQDTAQFVNKFTFHGKGINCDEWVVYPVDPFIFDQTTWQPSTIDSLPLN